MSRVRAAVFASVSVCLVSGLVAQEPPRPSVPLPPLSLAGPQPPMATPVAPPMPGQLQAAPATPPPEAVPLPPLPSAVPGVSLNKSKPVSSTSTSGQFIVHGDELTLRSALSDKCEGISLELRNLLHDKQPWALPIVVLLNTGEKARKGGQSVSTAISQLTHGGFHIQVTVNMRPDLRPADLRKEVIRALLAERILRDQKEIASQRKLLLPDWLFLGTLEALDFRQRARPSALFAALFKSGKIFGIEEIIEASASDIDDALSKTIYQTSCCALVLALLDQPDPGLRMGKFLNALASDPRSERELLNQWFPNFASTDASLNKWWALQLATLASPGMGEPLSPQDTVKALEEALTFHFQAKPSEVPQSSRRVMAAKPAPSKPSPVIREAATSPMAQVEEKPAETPGEEAAPSVEKRGFFGRLNPFARNQDSEDQIAAAIQQAALAEAHSNLPKNTKPADESSADAPPPVLSVPSSSSVPAVMQSGSAPASRKPLLDRWFGEEKKTPAPTSVTEEQSVASPAKPTDETAPEPADPASKAEKKEAVKSAKKEPKAAPAKSEAKEEPATAPAGPSTETEKKPSTLNPLKWFRGGKKEPKEDAAPQDSPAPVPAKEKETDRAKKAAFAPHSDSLTGDLLSGRPLVAFVYQEVAVEAPAPEPEKEKKRLFGLFGKKKEKDAAADPAEPEAPQVPAEKPKAKVKEKAPDTPPSAAVEESKKDREEPQLQKKEKSKPQEPATEAPVEESESKAEKPKRSLLPSFHLFGGKKDESKEGEKPTEETTADAPPSPPAPIPAPSAAQEAKPEAQPLRKPRQAPVAAKPAPPKDEKSVTASIPIEDYAVILKRKDLDKILEHNVHALNALQNRGSVLFRPIAIEYVSVMESIHKGRTKGLDARIHSLRVRTEEALEKSKAVRDLLDLHEANDSPALSGLFEDYLKLPETIQKELPERDDPISKYLDALDKEFSKD